MALYVYALCSRSPGARPGRGAQHEPLKGLRVGKLWAVAGEVEEAPVVEANALQAQDAVLRRLFARGLPLLPARFGTLIAGPRALAAVLGPQEAALRETLAQVEGQEQLTVRLFGDAQPAPAATRPDGGSGTAYLTALAARRAWERQVPELDPVRPLLAALVHGERVRRHDTPPLIASVYHLVARGQAARYRRVLGRAVRALGGLRVQVSGPFPPYAFAPEGL